ncbi:hypothetical protein GCM10017044_24070 [Kordiimonas sediminis]|uniref:Uncharacterized protein n=1 Tax=Kordiimonas sediminis TaxID=1735581 RepID=A0A919E9M6_9PROT|nr:hypothetical protein GCM10017044_24070 [Kordiimonas sediminis]
MIILNFEIKLHKLLAFSLDYIQGLNDGEYMAIEMTNSYMSRTVGVRD